jgi:hypothetical protein
VYPTRFNVGEAGATQEVPAGHYWNEDPINVGQKRSNVLFSMPSRTKSILFVSLMGQATVLQV